MLTGLAGLLDGASSPTWSLAVLTAVTIVASMRVVGILLVAALMVLPSVGTLLARSPVLTRSQSTGSVSSVPADVHDTAAERLRAVGQRFTASRRAVIEVLVVAGSPLTIPEVLHASPHLPQSSVYRNLAVLEQAGVVRRLLTSGDFARYELAEDLTEHHHHLVCSACGRVEDFTAPTELERRLDDAMGAVHEATGFAAEHHRLDLLGTCARCA